MTRTNQEKGVGVLRQLLIITVLPALFIAGAFSQNAANSANTSQPEPSPSAEPTPIAVSTIISEAEAVTARLRSIRSRSSEGSDLTEIEAQIPEAAQEIEAAEAEDRDVLAANPSLDVIGGLDSKWRAFARRLISWESTVQEAADAVDSDIAELNRLLQVWQLTLDAHGRSAQALEDTGTNPASVGDAVPAELVQRVTTTIASIEEARRQAQEQRAALLALQTRTSELEARVNAVRQDVRLARGRTLNNLFVREERPIWAAQNEIVSVGSLLTETMNSFSAQAFQLRTFASAHVERFALHGILFLIMTAGLYWARGRVHPFVEKEPKLEKAAQIFSLPIATALILSILASTWLYPQAPRLLTSILGAAALVPVVVLLRRMVERPLFIILNALVVLYFVDRLRDILVNQPLTARILFLIEMLGAILFMLWFLKSKKLSGGVEAAHYRIFKSIRKVIPFVLAIFVSAFTANVLGFVSLANLVGNGVLGSAYLAVILYTAVQIIRGLIVFALRVPPLNATLIVKNNRPIIRERSVRYVRWLAVIIWLLVTLNLFSIRQPIFGFLRDIFSWSATVGTISFSLGSVVLFFLMVWIAILISRFIRFVLEEDVYPRAGLGGGVSYAVSTMLHYSILVVGFLIAVGVLGVDFTKFALIAGAVGIGIGFGLQNIINNFVSGLILLVERPVKVNDTIQIGEHTGSLKQIGLRASVLRKVDGSDVIVPNSLLISEEVINWTMSDEKRRIDIPVGVAYGTDPRVIIDLLIPIGGKFPEVLQDPAPRVLFIGLGESSLDFELRVWTGHTEGWVGLRSDIMTEVYEALTTAGIEIPFPQRDLNIRSMDSSVGEELLKSSKGRA